MEGSSSNVPTLVDYYDRSGLPAGAWLVGPEHPALEELGLRLLANTKSARILELGVQSGGFAVPVILAAARRERFAYTGVDNLEYTNAVPLRYIATYLGLHGVTRGLRFVEGSSGTVVQAVTAHSYDLILIDHYKPRYPIDLYAICSRQALSEDGAIVLHDVLTHAAPDWIVCQRVCRAFGYDWTIDTEVSQGAAIVRRGGPARSKAMRLPVCVEVHARWWVHATILGVRRAIGRTLRRLGLRRSPSL
jgi:predicted O-methyltransferase YrrM